MTSNPVHRDIVSDLFLSFSLKIIWTQWGKCLNLQPLKNFGEFGHIYQDQGDNFSISFILNNNSTLLFCCSEVLYDGTMRKDALGRKIDAFSLFKRGIRPEWEDPQNTKATEWSTAKAFDLDVDVMWENLVLGLIGQTIEECDEICGCRVVDKYKKSNKSPQPHYRLELWLKLGVSKEKAESLKVRLLEVLADGDQSVIQKLPAFEYKTHS